MIQPFGCRASPGGGPGAGAAPAHLQAIQGKLGGMLCQSFPHETAGTKATSVAGKRHGKEKAFSAQIGSNTFESTGPFRKSFGSISLTASVLGRSDAFMGLT